MPTWFRAEMFFVGGIILSNLVTAISILRLHELLRRIYLSGVLTGRSDYPDGWK